MFTCFYLYKDFRRIKKKQIYVIMTARRPVPLEHFLYTGQDGKTKKDMFKIINSDGQFVQKGYQFDI